MARKTSVQWNNVGAKLGFKETQRELDDCNAFLDPNVADERGRRLSVRGER